MEHFTTKRRGLNNRVNVFFCLLYFSMWSSIRQSEQTLSRILDFRVALNRKRYPLIWSDLGNVYNFFIQIYVTILQKNLEKTLCKIIHTCTVVIQIQHSVYTEECFAIFPPFSRFDLHEKLSLEWTVAMLYRVTQIKIHYFKMVIIKKTSFLTKCGQSQKVSEKFF